MTTNRGMIPLTELRTNDILLVQNRKGDFGQRGNETLGRIWGWLIADGHISDNRAILDFYHDKRVLAPLFQDAIATILPPHSRYAPPTITTIPAEQRNQIKSTRLLQQLTNHGFKTDDKYHIPEVIWQGTEGMIRGFLQALFTADGTILNTNNGTRSIRLTNTSDSFLYNIQTLLSHFAIHSVIALNRRHAGTRMLPNDKGGSSPYNIQACHELIISKQNILTFAKEIGFLPFSTKATTLDRMTAAYSRGPYKDSFTTRIRQIIPDGTEEVFDLTEPDSHTFIANGLTISNCAEEPLEAYGACDLGSLNLLTFVKQPFADLPPDQNVDWPILRRAVASAVRFLDNILDWNRGRHPLPAQDAAAAKSRRIGLGVTALADMLAALRLPYGSAAALHFTDRLFQDIRDTAYLASTVLAVDKGPFPGFDRDTHLHQPFLQDLPTTLQHHIEAHGLRNVALLTVPPVGTGSALAGVSSGIEPIFSLAYTRRSESLSQSTFHVLHPLAHHYWTEILRTPLPHPNDFDAQARAALPDFFVTAHTIDPATRIDLQATIQRHIDAAISGTVNLPHNATIDTIDLLYRKAWDSGCKGITVFREGSRSGILLTPEEAARQQAGRAATTRLISIVNRLAGSALPPDARLSEIPHPIELDRVEQAIATLTRPQHDQLALLPTTPPLTPRPAVLRGITLNQDAPEGRIQITINEVNGEPFELICHGGKAGSDFLAYIQALSRCASMLLRLQRPASQRERLELLIDQWKNIAGSRSNGFGPNKTLSGPDAIAKALQDYLALTNASPPEGDRRSPEGDRRSPVISDVCLDTQLPTSDHASHSNGNCCPQCRRFSLMTDHGCLRCSQCSYREC